MRNLLHTKCNVRRRSSMRYNFQRSGKYKTLEVNLGLILSIYYILYEGQRIVYSDHQSFYQSNVIPESSFLSQSFIRNAHGSDDMFVSCKS